MSYTMNVLEKVKNKTQMSLNFIKREVLTTLQPYVDAHLNMRAGI